MLNFKSGLIPAIIQDDSTGEVLSLFYLDKEALEKTRKTGKIWRYSRTLGKVVQKGATSGNILAVSKIQKDCMGKSLLISVKPSGPACHTGKRSCYSKIGAKENISDDRPSGNVIAALDCIIADRKSNPKPGSFVSGIVAKPPKAAGKLLEESLELAQALKKGDVAWEAADVIFFALVLARSKGVGLAEIEAELKKRMK